MTPEQLKRLEEIKRRPVGSKLMTSEVVQITDDERYWLIVQLEAEAARVRELETQMQRLKVAIAEHRLCRWGDLPVDSGLDGQLYAILASPPQTPEKEETK